MKACSYGSWILMIGNLSPLKSISFFNVFFVQKISPENIFAGLMRQAPSSITGKIICIVVEAFWQHKWT